MKTSKKWLQGYFDAPLPDVSLLADALTFHAAEIEEAEGDLLDVNVLPDRASYLLSHRGVAKEISTALTIPLARDPLREPLPTFPKTDRLSMSIEDAMLCRRHIGALVTNVAVGPSPAWLKEALEAVGQRSINNVVDATNYVMLDIGQPLHAFDARKIQWDGETLSIRVRATEGEERITALSGEEYALPEGTLVIAEGKSGLPLDIAGIKGGQASAITEETTELFVSVANFDGGMVRKTAQALKLFTDASSRFQNKPSPALAGYGMRDVLALILKVAGGEVLGVVDEYPVTEEVLPVAVSLSSIRSVLGAPFTLDEVRDAFDRLGFSYVEVEDTFTVLPPFERNDIMVAEDLIEEVGRTIGYDRIEPLELPIATIAPDQSRFRGIERVRDFLIERGYTEVSTPSFAKEGEIELANPLQDDKPYLRPTLYPNLRDALLHAKTVAPRVLGPSPMVKLFEIGNTFTKDGESLILCLGALPLSIKKNAANDVVKENVATLGQELFQKHLSARFSIDGDIAEIDLGALNLEKLGDDYAPVTVRQGSYHPFSPYPSALRDVAVWTPEGTEMSEVTNAIISAAGDLLARIDLFDRFEKDGRTSFAFRLVFESMERTLADIDLDPAMALVTESLNANDGWEVR